MKIDEEIEDSLRICEELKEFYQKPEKEPEILERPEFDFTPYEQSAVPETVTKQEQTKEPKTAIAPEFTPEFAEEIKDEKAEEQQEESSPSHPVLRVVLNCVVCIAAALLLSILITKFVAHHTSVEGSSMENTLKSGDQLIVEKLSYYFSEPKRFDVIVFPYSKNVSYIKRIIGLPGETIKIEDGTIYINGEVLTEHYGKEQIENPGLAADEILLGEDEYFVLGDNRNASVDSRKAEVGTIKRSEIQGKAWLRFYPFDSIGVVK
jgi:signal peptidase I